MPQNNEQKNEIKISLIKQRGKQQFQKKVTQFTQTAEVKLNYLTQSLSYVT